MLPGVTGFQQVSALTTVTMKEPEAHTPVNACYERWSRGVGWDKVRPDWMTVQ